MNYLHLFILSVFALDWLCRMVRYACTKDERVFHIGWSWVKPIERRGLHERKTDIQR